MRPISILLVLAAVAWGCGGSATTLTPTPTPVATVTLSTSTAALAANATLQLTATTKDASGNVLAGRTVTWSSTAPIIATVSATGLVTAIAAGTTTISATSEGQSASATITVTPRVAPVASVTLSQAAATLVPASTLQLTATPKDSAGNTLAGRTITWITSAAGVATVSASGLVTAVAVGAATITATSEGESAGATITVVAGALIGAAGGTVSSPDGNATIMIPAGALNQATPISIAPAAGAPAYVLAGSAYDFLPTGTHFDIPATITLKYNPADVTTGMPPSVAQVDVDSSGVWVPVTGSGVDTVAHTVQAPVSHFTPYGAAIGPVYFAGATYTAADVAAQQQPRPSVWVCVGGVTSVTVEPVPGYILPAQPSFYGRTSPSKASVSLNGSTFVITGLSVGETFLVVTYHDAANETLTSVLTITVVNCANSTVPIAVSVHSSSSCDNVSFFSGSGPLVPVTTNCSGRYPVLGEAAGSATPLACRCVAGANLLEQACWSGVGGPCPTVPSPPPSPAFGTFVPPSILPPPGSPPGTYVYAGFTQSGAVDMYDISSSSAVTQLTRLGGSMGGIAISPNAATILFSWAPPSVGVTTHLFTIDLPATGGLPVTTGQVQVTTGSQSETNARLSQNGALVAYEQADPLFNHSQVLIQSTTPAATPVGVSPPTGFAFSPSWCGNEFVYYTFATSIGGPYTVMRWNAALNVSTPVATFTGLNVFDVSVARTDGDGGLHVCPP